ncbi:MAG: L-serine ammonia-lyase, iron-sulfur-dependent, subunit alpha [Bilophila sp.]
MRSSPIWRCSVRRGLDAEGYSPGRSRCSARPGCCGSKLRGCTPRRISLLTRLNAYAFATAEENAAGGVIVTAPTCGSAGVMPALVYALRHELFIGDRAIREAFLAAAAVGFIAKHNASIAGVEVGCQGEIGMLLPWPPLLWPTPGATARA